MTGKFELEYEGELRGADQIARELIRAAVANVFVGYFENVDTRGVVDWFDKGGTLQFDETASSASLLSDVARVPGLIDLAHHAGIDHRAAAPARAAAVGFILEGLAATKRISRTDDRGFQAADTSTPRRGRQQTAPDHDFDDLPSIPGGKKKYDN